MGKRDLALGLWCFLVAVTLLIPGDVASADWLADGARLDKIAHFVLFLVLGILAFRALTGRFEHALFLAVALSVVYGALLEVAQGALGTRSAELGDLAADALGSVCSAFLGHAPRRS